MLQYTNMASAFVQIFHWQSPPSKQGEQQKLDNVTSKCNPEESLACLRPHTTYKNTLFTYGIYKTAQLKIYDSEQYTNLQGCCTENQITKREV